MFRGIYAHRSGGRVPEQADLTGVLLRKYLTDFGSANGMGKKCLFFVNSEHFILLLPVVSYLPKPIPLVHFVLPGKTPTITRMVVD